MRGQLVNLFVDSIQQKQPFCNSSLHTCQISTLFYCHVSNIEQPFILYHMQQNWIYTIETSLNILNMQRADQKMKKTSPNTSCVIERHCICQQFLSYCSLSLYCFLLFWIRLLQPFPFTTTILTLIIMSLVYRLTFDLLLIYNIL